MVVSATGLASDRKCPSGAAKHPKPLISKQLFRAVRSSRVEQEVPAQWKGREFPSSPNRVRRLILEKNGSGRMSWQQDPGGSITSNYGNSRGLEIPWSRIEVGIFPPGYTVQQSSRL
jgi:hypothetical protein